MAFFEFHQNNSGGVFVYEKADGIGENVIIEADSAEDANDRALNIGIYFNGCSDGRDCSCCGDRWYPAYSDGDPVPSLYGEDVFGKNRVKSIFGDAYTGYVHYKDGTIKAF